MSARKHLRDLAFACGLLVLLILFYWPVTAGDRTMVPADILSTRQPWLSGAPAVPHNGLVADLVFENYVWKQFIVESLRAHELPLWNPYVLSGVPFLAAGQHSALYPFSLIFYILPLARAYGLFTVSQLLVAGLSLYYYARTIRLSRLAAAAGGLVFALSGFFLVSTVFPMIIAVAAWLPFILAVSERMLAAVAGESTSWRERLAAPLPWLILGSIALGLQFLAGHVEIFYYSLLVLGAYVVWRAVAELRRQRQALALFAAACALMVALGGGLGAVQVLPLYEHVSSNFRQDSATYEQIVGWAYPPRHLAAFLIPDVYGNPTQHSYVDFWSGETVVTLKNRAGDRQVLSIGAVPPGESPDALIMQAPRVQELIAQGYTVSEVFWGIKNYVEGGVYISLLGLLLALIGALKRPRRQAWFFIALGLFSLTLVFGQATYRLIFALPGISQLHSAFRWVFPYSLCIAVLAAMGVEVVARERSRLAGSLGLVALAGSGLVLAALALARRFPQQVLPLADRAVAALAKAPEAFADGRAFFSYEARNLLLFAACLGAAGVVLVAMRMVGRKGMLAEPAVDELGRRIDPSRSNACSCAEPAERAQDDSLQVPRLGTGSRRPWGTQGDTSGASEKPDAKDVTPHASRLTLYVSRFTFYVPRLALLAVLALDPWLWFHGFMPAADPAPLTQTPEVVQWLAQQPGPYRITIYDTQDRKPLPPNTNMLFGLRSVSGYDSIIPRWYAEVMSLIEPQELEYNQISRLTEPASLDSPILDLLGVRYVLSEETIDRPGYTLVHDGALRVYRNDDCLPRAFVTFEARTFADRQSLLAALPTADPRRAVLLEQAPVSYAPPREAPLFTITGPMLAPNAAEGCVIDAANSAPYLTALTIDDPSVKQTGLWPAVRRALGLAGPAGEGQVTYRGLTLADIWSRCGAAGATGVRITTADGQAVTIPAADLLRWPILVATQLDGQALSPAQGGPARLVFPPEAAAGYPASAWLTSIRTLEFVGAGAAPVEAPPVQFLEDSPNQVRLQVDMPSPGFLVLADNWAPGWVAYTTPAGETGERALTILRADGTVRAVQLPAGAQTVRFKYSPGSVKTGVFVSFMAGVALLLLAGAWLWARAYRPGGEEETARRVAKNTVVPMVLQLLNKGVDLVFAMLMLRLLGEVGQGKYYLATQVAVILDILTNFGLNTLLTREVARSRERANGYLWNTSILRLGLAAAAAPLLLLFLLVYPMAPDTRLAVVLLAVGLVPSSISAGLSAVFMAFEVMVIPAVITTVTTLLKVGLGAAVLLAGWGFLGLAGASIVVNTITMAILLALVVALFFRPHAEPSRAMQREMLVESYPLMINNLLAALFFKVDVFLLDRIWGSGVLGWYSVSYKLVDAAGIIPPTFTMAIFPLMSRYASSSHDSLYKAYIFAIKLLVAVALFIALIATALAYPLISILGGSAYLPHSAIALSIIVWYMPLGFINSVTQYVLIALNQQRYLTRAFAAGLACGLAANVLLIPRFGYQGAAAVHIFSELALLIPFYIGVRRYLAPVPWLGLLWRPFAAAGAAGVLLWLLRAQSPFVAALPVVATYLVLLFALGAFDAADRALLGQVLPIDRLLDRLHRRLPAQAG